MNSFLHRLLFDLVKLFAGNIVSFSILSAPAGVAQLVER